MRSAKILLVFALVGPLVGLIVFALGIGSMASINGKPEGMWVSPLVILYGLFFAHFVGLPWAVIAGLCASILAACTPRRGIWIGAAAGALSFATAAMFKAVPLPPPVSPEAPIDNTFTWTIAAVYLLVHAISATVSWLIARRFA